MTLNKNLHWFVCALFLLSCARQSSPTGGPKDTIPPVLERVTPPDETVNFNADNIEMLFSEDVILNNPKEQIIITPTIGKDYEISYRRNMVTLEFPDPLHDSTTYTFSFRDAIQDITEKNPVENLQLAYSTGTYLDSLYIEGTVIDLLKGIVLEDATVALHEENDTFNIFEHPATYFTKTSEEGKFRISHLKPGNYYLYAFKDNNRNLIVNSRTESYGFLSEYQYLLDNVDNVSVGLVSLNAGPLKMTSARPYNTYFNIRTTKNLRTFTMSATDSSDLSYTYGDDHASIKLYDTTEKDSIEVHLLAIDSIDNVIDTTLYAKYVTREVTPEEFSMTLESSSLLAHTGQMEAVLKFSKPLKEVNFDSLYFQVDSLTRISFEPTDLTWEPLPRLLTIKKSMDRSLFMTGEPQSIRSSRRQPAAPATEEESRTYINELNIRPAAFISIENDSSAQLVEHLQPKTAQDLAVINIGIETSAEAYIVQLVNQNYKVIQSVYNQPSVRFQNVTPGSYQIRLIIDRNNNGRWDPGNYFDNVEPEPVVYYRGEDGSTTIKGVNANWEVGSGEMFITY